MGTDGKFGVGNSRFGHFKFAMWYVYICKKGNKLYTGITTDLHNRLRQHKTSELIYQEKHIEAKQAAKREKQIKSWKRDKKLAMANLKALRQTLQGKFTLS
ncbi:MAG: GIY-YIG nuclease family protein [Endomicrobiales bacterium]|nr:GIY-YIG nuclease family protein [Endomicrobiales bacterium]